MGLSLITPPAAEPVTLAEAKSHCRVDIADDDALITSLITVARQQVEQETGLSLITQTWELTLDAFPDRQVAAESWRYRDGTFPESFIDLPRPPLASVVSVKYIDETGVEQTMSASNYKVITDRHPGRVALAYDKSWPTARSEPNAVTIRYTAGYGASGSSVPQSIRQWILLQIEHWYRNRGSAGDKPMTPLPFVSGLLDPHRVYAL